MAEPEAPPPAPAPVEVTNPDPISVEVVNPDPIPVDTGAETTAKTVASKAQTDARVLTAAGQRQTSNLWERTQQVIALGVVFASLTTAMFLIVFGALQRGDAEPVAFVFLASVANLVIGFYFGRTNHTRTGGVGPFDGR